MTGDEFYNKVCETLADVYTDWETDRQRKDNIIHALLNVAQFSVITPLRTYSLRAVSIFEYYILRVCFTPVVIIMTNMIDIVYAPAIPDNSGEEKGIMFKAIANRVMKVLFGREIIDVKTFVTKGGLNELSLKALRRYVN